ncbi:MAG: cation diffusion facilitator family transporter [Acidobacteriota bacterium]|nr:cation diffusion facilitator family transporter [Acidobacteriota bacterium]
MPERSARSYAALSIGTAVVTIFLKLAAWRMTRSVGLLSDAAESVVNLVAAIIAFWALSVSARPPDEGHPHGHTKAEYFASAAEGFLIFAAAVWIGVAAWSRLHAPQPLERISIGLAVSLAATALNGGVAVVLLAAGRRLHSITLRADGKHLLTDVWTSLGVVAAVLLVHFTGWLILDPLIAFAVAVNILWAGWKLIRESGLALIDAALPDEEQQQVADALSPFQAKGILFHAIRTRVAGPRRFVSLHVLVPGGWTVQRGHDLCEEIEAAVRETLPRATVLTHLEPREDPVSWEDRGLDRD